MARLRVLKPSEHNKLAFDSCISLTMARLRVLKQHREPLTSFLVRISLTMARLRVLKLHPWDDDPPRQPNFTHYGPFEGTETR